MNKCGVTFNISEIMPQMRIIKLRSNDGHVFEAPLKAMKQSTTIKGMIETITDDDENIDEIVNMPVVNSAILNKVIDWCIHHENDRQQEIEVTNDTVIDVWDKAFLNVNSQILMQIINAANYLDIKYLMDISCLTMANSLRGKNASQMAQILRVRCDFTPEELQQIEKENEWLRDK
ncbi:hypothetical protein B4U80_06559 [Leptotrombidium deliense]|uniref:S-phase kinase-associated protein 1-like protein n=1 Tax=Leptotrombidium deliense TaxID=299467 RepID=A0A443SCU1_9ACAR|nr:hypothetical protein B4U80_06559 [Leptotrombidium deliense]